MTKKAPATKLIKLYGENDRFQQVLALKENRQKRGKLGVFLVEGVIPLKQLLKAGWAIEGLWYARGAKLSEWATSVLRDARAAFHYEVPPGMLAQLSDKEETSELVATVEIPADEVRRIPIPESPLYVLFDRPQSPGNLGSSIRSCDALGASGVIITGHAADPYHPQAVRGSMGSLFAIPVVRLPSQNEVTPWIEKLRTRCPNLQIIGTSARATRHLKEVNFQLPTILIMGNETRGLSQGYKAACTDLVSIPQVGAASSLNVTCATSIILYEALMQRRLGATTL